MQSTIMMQTYSAHELLFPEKSIIFEQVVELLTLGFIEDPHTRFLYSSHSHEAYVAALPAYLRMVLKLALLSDASVTVIREYTPKPSTDFATDSAEDDNPPMISKMKAVSVLIPPHGNATFESSMAAIRAGVLSLPFKTGFGLIYRLLAKFLPNMNKMFEEVFPDKASQYNHWHLLFLCTHPDSQGQGLGKKLLLSMQDSVTQENKQSAEKARSNGQILGPCPVYLEASTEGSRRLYSRVGFHDQANATYGKISDGESVRRGKDGKVLGSRIFGMTWSPEKNLEME